MFRLYGEMDAHKDLNIMALCPLYEDTNSFGPGQKYYVKKSDIKEAKAWAEEGTGKRYTTLQGYMSFIVPGRS